jgi:hypothetical protein
MPSNGAYRRVPTAMEGGVETANTENDTQRKRKARKELVENISNKIHAGESSKREGVRAAPIVETLHA